VKIAHALLTVIKSAWRLVLINRSPNRHGHAEAEKQSRNDGNPCISNDKSLREFAGRNFVDGSVSCHNAVDLSSWKPLEQM
jgi:hypothetical protein